MMTFLVIAGKIPVILSNSQRPEDKTRMAEPESDFQSPDNHDSDTPVSSPSEPDPAIVIAAQFEKHAEELLEVLRKCAKVDDRVVDVSDDPEIEARKKEQEARREEMKRTIEEIKNLPYDERTKRIKAYVKAIMDRPSLLEQVKARLQAAEQRKRSEELLRQFGQESHTSIN
jgi:hypothetical protein